MLAPAIEQRNRRTVWASLKGKIAESWKVLFALLVFGFSWPWLNVELWTVIAPRIGEAMAPDFALSHIWRGCLYGGLLFGLAPILMASEGVLQWRANGKMFLLVLFAVTCVHWAGWAGFLAIPAFLDFVLP